MLQIAPMTEGLGVLCDALGSGNAGMSRRIEESQVDQGLSALCLARPRLLRGRKLNTALTSVARLGRCTVPPSSDELYFIVHCTGWLSIWARVEGYMTALTGSAKRPLFMMLDVSIEESLHYS